MRREIQNLEQWHERLANGPPINRQTVEYDQGFRNLTEDLISLHHDDVIALAAAFLSLPKFQGIVVSRYPYLFIDEYQDTDVGEHDPIRKKWIYCLDTSSVLSLMAEWRCTTPSKANRRSVVMIEKPTVRFEKIC